MGEDVKYKILSIDNENLSVTVSGNKYAATVKIFNCNTRGGFEIYDIKTDGVEVYIEGGLWFTGKELTDYDGVYSLPKIVIFAIEQLGFNSDYAKD